VDPVDWEELRRTVRVKHGWDLDSETYGTEEARLALAHLVGDDVLRATVDYYVAFRPARELARCALMILRPTCAVERCLEIYRTDPDPERRHWAVEALSWAGDGDSLPIVPELLEDPDLTVQRMGAAFLDQLVWTGLAHPPVAELFLRLADDHANPDVRRTAAQIRAYLRERGVPEIPRPTDKNSSGRCAMCGDELAGCRTVRWETLPGWQWHLSCQASLQGGMWLAELRRQHPEVEARDDA
jgi:hypothetical protein